MVGQIFLLQSWDKDKGCVNLISILLHCFYLIFNRLIKSCMKLLTIENHLDLHNAEPWLEACQLPSVEFVIFKFTKLEIFPPYKPIYRLPFNYCLTDCGVFILSVTFYVKDFVWILNLLIFWLYNRKHCNTFSLQIILMLLLNLCLVMVQTYFITGIRLILTHLKLKVFVL